MWVAQKQVYVFGGGYFEFFTFCPPPILAKLRLLTARPKKLCSTSNPAASNVAERVRVNLFINNYKKVYVTFDTLGK